MTSDASFTEGKSYEVVIEQIKALPDGPIRDIDTLIRIILKPYFEKIAHHGSPDLPTNDGLIKAIIQKFKIPNPKLQIYENPDLTHEEADFTDRWIMSVHWASPEVANQIEKIGGVLGFKDVDTLHTIRAPADLVNFSIGKSTEGHVFLTPLSINNWGTVSLPVRRYDPSFGREQLPQSYVIRAAKHFQSSDVTRNPNFLVDNTNIMQLAFNIARIERSKR